MLAPDGTSGEIPMDKVDAATKAGFKRAIEMTSPNGKPGYIPEDRQRDALNAGFKATGAPQRGFFGSFADATGLSALGDAITHPRETFNAINDLPNPNGVIATAVKNELGRSAAQLKEAWNTPNNQPLKVVDRTLYAIPGIGGALKTADEQAAAGNYAGAAGSAAGIGTALIAPEVFRGATRGAKVVAEGGADAYRGARSSVIGGSKLDEVISGDTVTPRQRYEAAKAQGVNLDTAQATGAPVASRLKQVSEHSLGGASKFEANNAANVQALHGYSEKLLNDASPVDMSREDFGNRSKASLLADQQKLNETSADIYKKLDADIGTSTPDTTPIRDVAQNIVDANKDYYEAHPDLLTGGAGRAWRIVNNLAESGEAPAPRTVTSPIVDASGAKITREVPGKAVRQDTWSDLHKLRSDLLDITRSPEMIGDRPTGWIKQLTGAVDDTMTKAADGDQVGNFREANDIYKYMKKTYDDPTSKLYHVVRSPDGLTAANTLANITPDVARKIGAADPELLPLLQRQTISRILNPSGNELSDLKNLPSRLSRAQKEQLAGVLTPKQIESLDNLARTSKLVTFDANPSGSGKLVQRSAEGSAVISGALRAAGGVVTGNPLAVAEGVSPAAWIGGTRLAASKLTNPEFTESIMNGRNDAIARKIKSKRRTR